ncbi:MAG: replication-associated recombination protein A [Planctomycetaceae bacterium]
MTGLFEQVERRNAAAARPLAARMRPRSLDEFVGQQHFLGEGKLLRRMLAAGRMQSLIFFGPPGTGKTTLAHLIAHHLRAKFTPLNAAACGVKELRDVLGDARQRLRQSGESTILFVDELHHFSKTQQDVLLPDVEEGVVTLIGATTSNPFFALVAALVSRSQIFEFQSLARDEIRTLLQTALTDDERGLGQSGVLATDEALTFLSEVSDGDARRALTALEIGVQSLQGTGVLFDLQVAQESIQKKAVLYDSDGDQHYDVISAFIKSIRGSDPDAAIYWLARMIEAGEDPRFIARRLVISAAEDIGNADPRALTLAMSAAEATERIGMPEARIILAQATTFLACSPKSNAAYMAIDAALDDVRHKRIIPVPNHLRDGHYAGAERLGHGEGYQYAHDAAGGWVNQDYLGVDRTYYHPTNRGLEATFRRYLESLEAQRIADREATVVSPETPPFDIP